ncbi:hypothetical protein BTO32_09190 [Marinobacter lutaoensis]|uniref:Kinase n=1 Tax=Marinobacter lutaoensis TaxID=135739 RepID=A0A1V2DTW5_9GAMM|nr:hypothetical protein BTO32_09190 [Marinobacter lutaoensis]
MGTLPVSDTALQTLVETLIQQEGLPPGYHRTVATTILPLARYIQALHERLGRPVVVGIHGAQGTGKSTLTLFLKQLLDHHFHLRAAAFSLDDLYLTRAERQTLADTVHPLLLTRGVPGTHDVALGLRLMDALVSAKPGQTTSIPSFDKARDDRAPDDQWPVFEGPAQVILFEGWCVAARPEPDADLARPVNALEAEEDADGAWRRYVNDCLKGPYRELFERLDTLVMLKAPSLACVREWRTLQEHKLAEKVGSAPESGNDAAGAPPSRIMSDQAVARFIMHYQRTTEHCLRDLPDRADVLIEVAPDHSLSEPRFRPPPATE